jgi:uncharacterized membrane protein
VAKGDRATEGKQIGPIQLIVVAFEHPEIKGEIARELDLLRERGDIRVVDAMAVRKNEDGSVDRLKFSDYTPDEKVELGAIIGGLVGLGAGGEEGAEVGALTGAILVADEYEYGVDTEGLDSIAEDLPPGGAALYLMIEHRWALGLKRAIRGMGGILVAQDFLSPEALIGVGRALMAAVEAEEAKGGGG